MALKKGEGEPFIAIVHDGSDSAKIIINRFFTGLEPKKGRVEAHRQDKVSAEQFIGATAVVQLITRPVETTTEGIHVTTGDLLFDSSTRKLVQVFHPAFFIRKKADDSLLGKLIDKRVPAMGIAVSPMQKLSDKEVNFVVQGFTHLLQREHMVDGGFTLRTLAVFSRHPYTAKTPGLFVPKVPLFEPVTKGQLIGILKTPSTKIEVKAKHDGKVLELLWEKPVKNNDLLFAIGEPTTF